MARETRYRGVVPEERRRHASLLSHSAEPEGRGPGAAAAGEEVREDAVSGAAEVDFTEGRLLSLFIWPGPRKG